MTDVTCPVCGGYMNDAYTDDGDYGCVCLNDNCPLDCCIFTMEEISKPRPLETAMRARIAELESLLSKQAESDNNWKCPKCGGKLTVVLDCTNRHCEWYSMTGAELRSRLTALEAENARLKAEIAQHDWWGGGGR